MKRVYVGIVHIDVTNPFNFYLLTGDKPINSQDIFGEFEGKKVRITIQDIEENQDAIKVLESVLCTA